MKTNPNYIMLIKFVIHIETEVLEPSLKHTLRRHLPYIIGGIITVIIITYYYLFLYSIILNIFDWLVISTIVNNY